MRVIAVCGGELPPKIELDDIDPGIDLLAWAREHKCLFTIVDDHDEPKLVIEFFSGLGEVIDTAQLEHQRLLKPILAAAGISYITFTDDEFSELLAPDSDIDFCTLLQAKVEDVGIRV